MHRRKGFIHFIFIGLLLYKTLIIEVMKQIILFFASIRSIKRIAKAFVVFNMGISYFDSTSFFYRLYDLSLQTLGLSVFLLSYFFVIYWKKVTEISIDSSVKKYFISLKIILFIFLITPVFIESNWQIVKFHDLDTVNVIRAAFEIMKILCIEFIIEILFNVIKSIKNKE